MSNPVAELKSLLHDQPQNPLRATQVQEYQEESNRLHSQINAPAWQGGANRGESTKRYKVIQRILHEQAAKPLEADRRDKVSKLCNEVLEQRIKPSMLTQAEMRRNPAGAVDTFLKRENSKETKDAILAWKRGMRAIEPDNDEQDYTNLERYRPSGINPDGTSTFMSDAQIPGKFAMTPKAKENWPLGDPVVDTPLKQVKRRELSEDAKQAARERLAKAREAQQAKRAAKVPTLRGEAPVQET